MAAACSNVGLAGFGANALSEADRYSAKAPVPRLKLRHASADRLDPPGGVDAPNAELRCARPEAQPGPDAAHDVREPSHDAPVSRIHGGRVNAHEHFSVPDNRLRQFPDLEHLRRAIPILNDCFHRVLTSAAGLDTG
jgi:hypothetical protein